MVTFLQIVYRVAGKKMYDAGYFSSSFVQSISLFQSTKIDSFQVLTNCQIRKICVKLFTGTWRIQPLSCKLFTICGFIYK